MLWQGQAGLQGVAVIYGPAQVYQVSPYYMVRPVSGCHHSICSSLGVGITIHQQITKNLAGPKTKVNCQPQLVINHGTMQVHYVPGLTIYYGDTHTQAGPYTMVTPRPDHILW